MLGNPLPGRIQAHEEVWDRSSFRVTSTFAQHAASGRGLGIDFGNGRCGDEVYASEAGQIIGAFTDAGNGAVIVRIRHPQFGNVVTGYAHLQSVEVGLVPVSRGQAIGHVGKTGADACHLHWGVNINGVEVDGWPLLDQNIMEHDVELKGTIIEWINNRRTTVTYATGLGLANDPTLGTRQNLATLGAGTAFTPSAKVRGISFLGSDSWYGGWITGTPPKFGYLPVAGCGPLVPAETVEVPGPIAPPVIIEVPSTEPTLPAPTDVATAKTVLLAAGIDVDGARADLIAQTTALNSIATARSRAVTLKNSARTKLEVNP